MRLRNAPLVHVLAHVVYPTVLNWAERVAPVAERFADIGFPRARRSDAPEFVFQFGPDGVQQPTAPVIRTVWEFADAEEYAGIVLTDTSIVLQTSRYRTHEEFFTILERCLTAARDVIGPRLVDRLGLRYVDLVQPARGESLGQYVDQGLLGFPFQKVPKLNVAGRGFVTQSLATTPFGTLAIRSAVVEPGRHLPPDLNPWSLRRPDTVDTSRPGLIVDFDHFTMFTGPGTTPMTFVPQTIIAHFETLHRTVRTAFDVITTPHAISRWGPWE